MADISNYVYNTLVAGSSGADSIYNSGDNVTILGGAGNDTINTVGFSSRVDGGAGADSICLGVGGAVAAGGDGDDTIWGYYWGSSISGGAGDDVIALQSGGGSHVGTINGGKGDDTFLAVSGTTHHRLYQYAFGDGIDQIYGFDENDTLQISGSYSTLSRNRRHRRGDSEKRRNSFRRQYSDRAFKPNHWHRLR